MKPAPRPVHRGVYLVGHVATAPLAYEAAAMLAFQGKGTISHRSAAKLQAFAWPTKAHLGDHTARRFRSARLVVRKAALEPCDITSIERLRSRPRHARSVDCQRPLGPMRIMRSRRCARRQIRKAKPPTLWSRSSKPGKPGVVRLTKSSPITSPRDRSESSNGVCFGSFANQTFLSQRSTPSAGQGTDLIWREQKIVVEADSYTFHGDARRGLGTSARRTIFSSPAPGPPIHMVRRDGTPAVGARQDQAGAAGTQLRQRSARPFRGGRRVLSRVSIAGLGEEASGSGRFWGSKPVKRRASRATSATSRMVRPVALPKCSSWGSVSPSDGPISMDSCPNLPIGGLYRRSVPFGLCQTQPVSTPEVAQAPAERPSDVLRKPVPGPMFRWVKIASWIELGLFGILLVGLASARPRAPDLLRGPCARHRLHRACAR